MAVNIHTTVFWVMAPCSLAGDHRSIRI